MIRTCIVDTTINRVVNIVEYDKVPKDTPPGFDDGKIAVASDDAQIGWSWASKKLHPPSPDASVGIASRKASRKASAQAALNRTDLVALRCFKAGIGYPAEWLSYTNALRATLNSDELDGVLPSQPAYPVNT